jgi:hypothetical protein
MLIARFRNLITVTLYSRVYKGVFHEQFSKFRWRQWPSKNF